MLLGAVDVGAALVMSHMLLEALCDLTLAPELPQKRDAQPAAAAVREMAQLARWQLR